MANLTFNIAKGRVAELQRRVVNNDPTNSGLIIRLFKTIEADAALQDRATLADILTGTSVECDFTNYTHKILTDADLSAPTVDNTANTQSVALPAVQWGSAGGTTNNTIVKGIVFYCSDVTAITTANQIPLTMHDVAEITNGNNLNLNAGTFHTAS